MLDSSIYTAIRLGLPKANWQGKVLIIGAGVAGLTAAQILQKTGIEVEIVEASSRWGGRIRSEDGFYPFAIECGAEEIHGANSVWYQIIQNYGFPTLSYVDELEDYFLIRGQLVAESDIEAYPDLEKVFELWEELETYEPAPEQTLADYILEKAIPASVLYIAEAIWEAEFGTSVKNINLASLLEIHRKWQSGEENFVLSSHAFSDVLEKVFEDIIPHIQLNQVVQHVEYHRDPIILSSNTGKAFKADKVLLTVPVNVLKSSCITFLPDLPLTKKLAIDQISMDSGMKIMLKFQQAFWPEDMSSVYGPGLIPEFYTSSKDDTPILTGYVMGEKAQQLSKMSEDQLIAQVLGELGQRFHRGITRAELLDYRVVDWGKEPFICGAYSYPTKQAEYYRKILAASLDNRLYFAGEATNHQGQAATVQGAIESAYRAVRELLALDKEMKP